MDVELLFPGRFIHSKSFKAKDITLRIAKVEVEDFPDDTKKPKKAVMTFSNAKQQLILNKTNAFCIAAMFGKETANWLGKRVTFFAAPNYFGDSDTATRVRGSPDIGQDVTFTLSLPRKKPMQVTLKRIVLAPKPGSQPASASASATQQAAQVVQNPAPPPAPQSEEQQSEAPDEPSEESDLEREARESEARAAAEGNAWS